MNEFVNRLEEIADTSQVKQGSMKKVGYHHYYLAQEGINRLELYRKVKRKNVARSHTRLVSAAVSLMGEFSKHTGYLGDFDVNRDFIVALKEEVSRTRFVPYDIIEEAIETICRYVDLPYEEKWRAPQLLLRASALIYKQFQREII